MAFIELKEFENRSPELRVTEELMREFLEQISLIVPADLISVVPFRGYLELGGCDGDGLLWGLAEFFPFDQCVFGLKSLGISPLTGPFLTPDGDAWQVIFGGLRLYAVFPQMSRLSLLFHTQPRPDLPHRRKQLSLFVSPYW